MCKYLTNDLVQILNLNNILINFNKTKKSRCFGRFATCFWLMIIHMTIFFVNDNDDNARQNKLLVFGRFSELEVNIIRYFKTLTFRNRLQFDNSVPLVIFLYLGIIMNG